MGITRAFCCIFFSFHRIRHGIRILWIFSGFFRLRLCLAGSERQTVAPDLQEPGILHAEEPQRAELRVRPEFPEDVGSAGDRPEPGKQLPVLCVDLFRRTTERVDPTDPDKDDLPVHGDYKVGGSLAVLHDLHDPAPGPCNGQRVTKPAGRRPAPVMSTPRGRGGYLLPFCRDRSPRFSGGYRYERNPAGARYPCRCQYAVSHLAFVIFLL